MDRTLLERMVGAVVLVLLFVLFAPVLLDGSADGDNDQPARAPEQNGKRTEVIILNAPVNAADNGGDRTPVAPPPRQTEPAPKAVVKPSPPPAPPSPGPAAKALPSGFVVQLGSFSARDNAERYAARIKTEGYKAFVVRGSAAGSAIYRVYSGPEKNRAAADKLAARLKSAGHSVMVTRLGGDSGG